QGLAAATSATGQYHKDIQEARITREQSRRMAYDTMRKRVEFETWYEQRKQRLWKEEIEQGKRNRLDRARRSASDGEIWRGESLNVLLKSVLDSPRGLGGPDIPVEPRTLAGLNFVEKGATGSLGMVKDAGRIAWAPALQDRVFDRERTRFEEVFASASSTLRGGETPSRETLAELRSLQKRLVDNLNDEYTSLAPGDFTVAKRQLASLKDAIAGLADPRSAKRAGVPRRDLRSVGDIVRHLRDNGMEFGPASASDDQPAYSAFYHALRDYEQAVAYSAR
ncbi:MAG: hypothetical protein K2W96_18370, partial [Gemmataceae bacterium]|nr:hypothetical protein [Gemmataceae bacterium]